MTLELREFVTAPENLPNAHYVMIGLYVSYNGEVPKYTNLIFTATRVWWAQFQIDPHFKITTLQQVIEIVPSALAVQTKGII